MLAPLHQCHFLLSEVTVVTKRRTLTAPARWNFQIGRLLCLHDMTRPEANHDDHMHQRRDNETAFMMHYSSSSCSGGAGGNGSGSSSSSSHGTFVSLVLPGASEITILCDPALEHSVRIMCVLLVSSFSLDR